MLGDQPFDGGTEALRIRGCRGLQQGRKQVDLLIGIVVLGGLVEIPQHAGGGFTRILIRAPGSKMRH